MRGVHGVIVCLELPAFYNLKNRMYVILVIKYKYISIRVAKRF